MTIDSIDSAMNRSANRSVFVGAAVKYLGPARGKHDAEFLADLMVAAIDQICAAAGVVIQPSADIPDTLLKAIGEQAVQHAEAIAHTAVAVLTDVFLKTLICAARARGEIAG